MEYRTLGATGLHVSKASLGSGGPSRLGQSTGGATTESVRELVDTARELGINFFDTAPEYGDSESLLGGALEGVPRDEYVLATKYRPWDGEGLVLDRGELLSSVDRSLERLGVDTIDVFQLHAVLPLDYERVRDEYVPALEQLQQAGKIRFVGITEHQIEDPRHEMLAKALSDGVWKTIMVGYNVMNPTAEQEIIPRAHEAGVGVIGMVAVRKGLSDPAYLRERVQMGKAEGVIAADSLPDEDPLGWLVTGDVASLPEAGYRFVSANPAVGTVLTGTGRVAHLRDNVNAILSPPLPPEHVDRIRAVFGDVSIGLAD